MGRKYNSSSDRRWEQRYQRIQDKKESQLDCPSVRSKRREENRKARRAKLPALNIGRVVSGYDAVICSSRSQLDTLVEVIKRHFGYEVGIIGIRNDLQFGIEKFVVRVAMDYNWLNWVPVITIDNFELFSNTAFRLVDYYDLLPVNDLGKVQKSPDSVENLLGL